MECVRHMGACFFSRLSGVCSNHFHIFICDAFDDTRRAFNESPHLRKYCFSFDSCQIDCSTFEIFTIRIQTTVLAKYYRRTKDE